MPDLVVRPADADEIAALLKLAFAGNIPVTPRAGASTAYFNAVPIQGGIVMDLNLLKGVEVLDEAGMTVTAMAGTTWGELDAYLNTRGFALKSFPSSAPAATVGGWFCTMGYGIGSIKYGSLLSQVKAAEVVLPTGEIRRLTRETEPPLAWFAASEGTLGVITQMELEIRKLSPMKHFLIAFPDAGKMGRALEAIIHASVIPYNVHFADDRCALAMKSLGFSPADVAPAHTLGIDYEGSEENLRQADDIITALTAADPAAHLFSAETAEREWAEKFNALRLKRGGPSVLGAEIWLPVKALPDYLADIQKMVDRYGADFISYGHVVTPDRATVMTMFYTDETRTIAYILDLSLVKKIHDVGRCHGGWPYGVGLWNTPYLGRMFTPPQLAERKRRKRELDGRGIMNPGKGRRPPFMLNPFPFEVGMDLLAMARRATGKSRR
ncbi:MAG: hypothetical protein AUK26_09610 [Syntrophaceae bacterium CG2_30_58_14]|nr:MAG: hypothetical protein AUK26_09610 [Syntrophaceae bacterium CG2_30_58_14]